MPLLVEDNLIKVLKELKLSDKTIQKAIKINETYDINGEKIKNDDKEIKVKKDKKERKLTPYNNFMKEIYKKVKDKNPDMSFGDISKKISHEWKNLNIEEKEKYKN